MTQKNLENAIQTYLEGYFLNHYQEAGLPETIRLWQLGFNGVLSSATEYPACLILVTGREWYDDYFTAFDVDVMLAVSGDVSEETEATGERWADLLEEAIRSDWHFGGSVYDTRDFRIECEALSGVYAMVAHMSLIIDRGGDIYEKN